MGLNPDSYTFSFVLKAVVGENTGKKIHCRAVCNGLDSDDHVAAALIQMYLKCGRVLDARKVFDGMLFRGAASWNAMIAGYAKLGHPDSALSLFEQMPQGWYGKSVITWTSVISGYAQANRPSEAITIFRRMQLQGVQPDEVAMLAALSAAAQLGALQLGNWIHNYINNNKLCLTIPLANALIDMYAKSGNVHKAIEIFDNMDNRSVVTWTTIIAALAMHGLAAEALEIFSRMETSKVRPNSVTLLAVISACSHAGLVKLGRFYFEAMYPRYRIKPRVQHYGCIIDLLGRAGRLAEARQLLKDMPFEPNSAIWGSLLAACRIHGDIELGEEAMQHLLKMEPHNSGNYSHMSNIYSSFGKWKKAGITRNMMRDTGVKKVAGGSCIEVNNRLNEFIAGDRSHPQADIIYNLLHVVYGQFNIEATDVFD
nr:PREDICTED: pentatricopeptide repeat-containing protein At5g56310 [Daucus carota subsp. sativus]